MRDDHPSTRPCGGNGNDKLIGDKGNDLLAEGLDGDGGIDLPAFGFTGITEAKAVAQNGGSDVIFNFGPNAPLAIENITKTDLGMLDFIIRTAG